MNKKFNCPKCGTTVDFDLDKVRKGKKFKLCPNEDCITELECITKDGELILIAYDF